MDEDDDEFLHSQETDGCKWITKKLDVLELLLKAKGRLAERTECSGEALAFAFVF